MKLLLQRVTQASVSVDERVISSIGPGYLLLLGVEQGDTSAQAQLLTQKVCKLRLFDSESGKINDRSIIDMNGEVLVVSQFTLAGSTDKGSRPDYTKAAPPEEAQVLYEYFINQFSAAGIRVAAGQFGAYMQVELINDGPVTLLLER